MNPDARMLPEHVRQQGSRKHRIWRRSQSKPDRAALSLCQQLCGVLKICSLRYYFPRLLCHHNAERCEFVAFPNPIYQAGIQFLLKHLNAAAQRGLSKVKHLRRAAERARFHQRKEMLQMVKIHCELLLPRGWGTPE